jgi:hypothetical protein
VIGINLNLNTYQNELILSKDEIHVYVWDPIRRKKIVLLPEEMVRQLLLQYFIANKYPISRIAVEKSFKINGLLKRFDIVIFDQYAKPYLLVETKAPNITINQSTIDQLLSYNLALDATYQMVSNGINNYCFKVDKEKKQLINIPYLPEI